jgi:hypothetical protein
MTKILAILITAAPLAAETQVFKVCNEKTCYEVKLDTKSYEWMRNNDGNRFMRVYAPDGTAVDITGRDLQIETKSIKKTQHRRLRQSAHK